MTLLGTDLLVGGALNAEQLVLALRAIFDVERDDVYQSELIEREGDQARHKTYTCYGSTIGKRNVLLTYEYSAKGSVNFIVDMEFITPVEPRRLQRLCDEFNLVVGLFRDAAYPRAAGRVSGERYVLFRRGETPILATPLEDHTGGPPISWELLGQRLPPLPALLPLKSVQVQSESPPRTA